MRFEFSTAIDRINCHIRAFSDGVIPDESVNDRPHKHYFMEFHCVFAGEETVFLPMEDREIHLRPGQILLLPRGVYHGVTTQNKTVDRICFNFSAEPAQKENSPILEVFLTCREVMVFEDPDAVGFVRQCHQLRLQNGAPLSKERQGMLLLSTVLHLFSCMAGAYPLRTREASNALRQQWVVEDYIERHFTDTTGLEGLAQALYLSQRQTRKLVRQFLGEDYKSIIIRRRMELADIYLRDHEKNLEEIAWQVGYRSYSGFQLCFKKYFGVTPSERRMQILGK